MNAPIEITAELLRRMPLPKPDGLMDKESRGRVMVIGGSRGAPGAAILTGTAALRGGAGKVQLAVPKSLAVPLGLAFLEAGVCALAETDDGDPALENADQACEIAKSCDVVVIGPGIMGEQAAVDLAHAILAQLVGPLFIIDAMALTGLWDAQTLLRRHDSRLIITPHAGEMARLAGVSKEEVCADSARLARDAAERLSALVVLKGATTHIATPDGRLFTHTKGVAGLATAGSGDVLAGLMAALAARGADAITAAAWSVHVHARAGEYLAEKIGPVGFLAHELLARIPAQLHATHG